MCRAHIFLSTQQFWRDWSDFPRYSNIWGSHADRLQLLRKWDQTPEIQQLDPKNEPLKFEKSSDHLFPHPHFPLPFPGEFSLISSLALYLSKSLLEPLFHHPRRGLGSGSASAARSDSAARSGFQLQTCLPRQLRAGSNQRMRATTLPWHDEMAAGPRATSASAVSLSRMPA